MYVCMHACMYACMYVCRHVHTYVYTHIDVYTCTNKTIRNIYKSNQKYRFTNTYLYIFSFTERDR